MNRHFLTLCLVLALCCPVVAMIALGPDGTIALAPEGTVAVAGVSSAVPEPPTGGWVNATMTSAVEPAPNAVTSSASTGDAWKAFDHDAGTLTQFDGNAPGTPGLAFDFGDGVAEVVDRIKVTASAGYALKTFSFSGRSSGAWVVLASGTALDVGTEQEFVATNSTGYRFYLLEWSDCYDVGMQVILAEVKLWKD